MISLGYLLIIKTIIMVNSTLEDMVLYLYNDLDGPKKMQMNSELDANWALKEKYQVMKESYDRLNKMKLFSPRRQTVEAILKYASSKSVINSR